MATPPRLLQPVTFRSVTARNRIVVSPMCQYSATDGVGDDWHVQHLGARAMGGAGIVFTEATHVSAIGRITPGCLGLWNDAQQALLTRLAAVINRGGAVPGVQIAHAGRKASTDVTWRGGAPIPVAEGGWVPVGPSPIAFSPAHTTPHPLSVAEIAGIVDEFAATARRIRAAGFKVIEIHGAHGYLIHSFLSPISNQRNDGYGGDLSGRMRMLLEVVDAVRSEWPDELPLFVRLSAVDRVEHGLTLEDTVEIARRLKATGKVDLIDCSSGGIAGSAPPPVGAIFPGYQVPYAERVRHGAEIATGAVGMITSAELAAEIVANDRADLVFVARAILADPAWPLHVAKHFGAPLPLPDQYHRAVLAEA
jgi:2,4-dienoyl-CoA reductase-like NADH-dependent reductase (Old Yellow Enzyme family)